MRDDNFEAYKNIHKMLSVVNRNTYNEISESVSG